MKEKTVLPSKRTLPPVARAVSDQFEAFARSLPALLEPILKASEGRVAAAAANAILKEMRELKLSQLANEAATLTLTEVVAAEKKTSGEHRLDLDGKMLRFEARLSELEHPTIPAPPPDRIG